VTPKLPQVKARILIRVARGLGFILDRQSGSHAIYYRESDKRRIVVPIHAGKTIKTKTLFGIVRDMGLDMEEFINLL
jgi:predicted RNA binding protein YcfA (HicA-like mRNA interferase family)